VPRLGRSQRFLSLPMSQMGSQGYEGFEIDTQNITYAIDGFFVNQAQQQYGAQDAPVSVDCGPEYVNGMVGDVPEQVIKEIDQGSLAVWYCHGSGSCDGLGTCSNPNSCTYYYADLATGEIYEGGACNFTTVASG